MYLKKLFVAGVIFMLFVSIGSAKIFVVRDGVKSNYKDGSIITLKTSEQKNTYVVFNGTIIKLSADISYSLEEKTYEGRKALAIKSGDSGYVVIGNTLLRTNEGQSNILLVLKEDSHEINIKVLEGGVDVLSTSDKVTIESYQAGGSFSILALDSEIQNDNYQQFKNDFVNPISVSNP
ncbi:MAG: hypothetical protein FWD54_00595 [Endomicrobia bacterium]|nr:hypothetical protein [Endomicrobiia bacterium]MCL2798771.1 hypothetical protein [Endomicrobiia bacterium]